ncbi:MAG TPA: cytochrome-c peroxidase [Gammaproteobacteria bacterium]|nr:cytochrome-c peroxidase [Gammaproteobacteria bacterium]
MLAAAGAMLLAGNAAAYDWQALPDKAPSPDHNPTTEAKVELGKKLFFDQRYSATGTVSCNTCHNIMEGGDDGRPTSMGVHGRTGPRNAPTVWNSAFNSTQFWDGRAKNLEEQAKGPVQADVEMGVEQLQTALERVTSIPAYRDMFKQAFPRDDDPISVDNGARAVAAFERTLITPNSPYDRYVKGDKDALSEQQVRGMKTFNQVGCTSCHSGPVFNGPQMNMAEGQGFYQKFPTFTDNQYVDKYDLMADQGRARATGKDADQHMYKVPTLRNVALTAPYFHNGKVKTLPEAVRVMGKVQLNKDLSDKQVADIVAFLKGLTGEFPQMTLPRLPSKPGETIVEAGDTKAGGGAH